MDSPAAQYATEPRRTVAGAQVILREQIDWAIEAANLTAHLTGDFPNARVNREIIEIINLRLQEARLLAGRL